VPGFDCPCVGTFVLEGSTVDDDGVAAAADAGP